MRFSLSKKDLHRMLLLASRGAADDKSPVPALSHIHIRVHGGRVRCEATTVYSAVSIEAPVSTEGSHPFDLGETLAPKDLTARVGVMPDGMLQLRLEGHQLILTHAVAPRRFQMSALPMDGWSHNLKFPEWSLLLPTATLLRLFESVEHAIGTDEAKGNTNSAFIEWKDGKLSAVATDGHRLTHVALPVDNLSSDPNGSNEMMLRRNDLRMFKALLEQGLREERKDVRLHHGNGTAGLVIGEVQAMARLTDGVFPPWRQALPPTWKRRFLLDRAKLYDAITAVMVTDRETMVLEVKAGGKELFVSADNASSGDAGDAIDIADATIEKGFDAACSLKVSPKYAKDAVGAFDGEQVALCVTGDGRDQLFLARGDDKPAFPGQCSHLSLIMPMS